MSFQRFSPLQGRNGGMFFHLIRRMIARWKSYFSIKQRFEYANINRDQVHGCSFHIADD
jgi:hypothetical protein